PPSYTGKFKPARADLPFAGLDDSVYKSKVSETVTSKDSLEKPKTIRPSALIIKDWESDIENTRKSVIEQHTYRQAENLRKSQREVRPVWNNAQRVNHQNKLTHPHPKRNFVPTAIATKFGIVPVNAAKQSSRRAAASISTARHVNTAALKQKGNPQYTLQDQGIFDSGCSRHITGNKSFLTDYQEIDGGFVAFKGSLKGEPFNDVYQTPAHTKKVFTNMKRKGKDFSRRVTPLFALMLAPLVVEGEGSGQPSEPQPVPSTAQPRIKEQIPTSIPIPNVADEAVFKEWDDRVVRATTTSASLNAAQASGDRPRCQEAMGGVIARHGLREHLFILMSSTSPGGGHTPGKCEVDSNINELMAIYTNFSNRVLALEQSKTAQDLVIRKLKKKVRKLEKKLRARNYKDENFKLGDLQEKVLDVVMQWRMLKVDFDTLGRNNAEQTTTTGDTVNTASIDVSAVGPSNVSTTDPSTSIAGDIFEDEMMTIVDTLVAIRSTRPRTTSVIIHDVEEELRRKAQIQIDEELAIRLHEEEKAELERMQRERAAQEKAYNAALIAEFDNVQARMEADALLAARLQEKERERFSIVEFTYNQLKNKSLEEIHKLYKREQKWINDFVPIDSKVVKDSRKGKVEGSRKKTIARKRTGEKLDDESVKRQKIEDDAEKEELRAYLDIILGEDEAVNVESLAIKYLIVYWKTHALSEDKMYYEIIRGDRSTKLSYKIFTIMLDDFDMQDVLDLYRLVKERFKTPSLEGYDRLLWGDLITVFEPSEVDDICKAQ
ncbi:hypothetical protein Tco_1140420, partial [Tanacetum coccineum]